MPRLDHQERGVSSHDLFAMPRRVVLDVRQDVDAMHVRHDETQHGR